MKNKKKKKKASHNWGSSCSLSSLIVTSKQRTKTNKTMTKKKPKRDRATTVRLNIDTAARISSQKGMWLKIQPPRSLKNKNLCSTDGSKIAE